MSKIIDKKTLAEELELTPEQKRKLSKFMKNISPDPCWRCKGLGIEATEINDGGWDMIYQEKPCLGCDGAGTNEGWLTVKP